MFAFPMINTVSMISASGAVGGGMLDLPAAGAILGAILIAALVGSALGLLRNATSPHHVAQAPRSPMAATPHPLDGRHEHREAA